ncbi:hypothetical protein LO772_31685 [Yinghuangia sp. ASG 101]|uniref:hypothetical protein n=1 Tax=Yinghuangia sp. ASG 101 TaxID=2896848 RepID=UPI001E6024EB|nr:hypothetical protein [Yinghuangia sp. ASG 101]UGQ11310.1 hypothetical protein LO772_31685 [Yinghuangia sp. ASG 101]
MGVITDFLRAPDDVVIVRAMDEEWKQNLFEMGLLAETEQVGEDENWSYHGEGLRVLDRVSADGMYAPGVLPALLGAARGATPTSVLVGEELVWPRRPTADELDAAGVSPMDSGPWVTRLDDDVRDTLADITDADAPRVAAKWGECEALRAFDTSCEELRDAVMLLAGFARKARDAGDRLYRYVSL